MMDTWYMRIPVLLVTAELASPDSSVSFSPLNMPLPVISFILYPEQGFLYQVMEELIRDSFLHLYQILQYQRRNMITAQGREENNLLNILLLHQTSQYP
jgi:hypothetical protein